ncbi:MAG: hypothetical protein K1X48_04035 [Burkholderiaceae bacterium]|nr:hypothetical protein [Burkholderiaceae bacterium]
MRIIRSSHLASYTLVLTAFLSACGGGGGENSPTPPPPVQQWPQSVAFTDFTGGQSNFTIGFYSYAQSECQTCITAQVAQSGIELGNLLPQRKSPAHWPPPYNDKLYAELPIDYNSKTAVVLEDKGSGVMYHYTLQKVEESANTMSISVLKCMVSDPYNNGATVTFGLLLPKTTKPIQVLTVQSGKPTLPEYQPNGLGAC